MSIIVPDHSKRGSRQAFRTRAEGHNMRRATYVCRECKNRFTSKPKASRPVCDGPGGCGNGEFYYFPSEGEARRYAQLLLQERMGLVSDLLLQVPEIYLPITIRDVTGADVVLFIYRPDFVYRHHERGRIWEDYKARSDQAREPIFRMKQKAVRLQYGIEITLTH